MAAAGSRAKTPLIVGGAAAAGLAGGLAVLNRRRASRGLVERVRLAVSGRDGTIDFESIAAAANGVSSFGERIAAVASALQRASEGVDKN